MESSTPGSPLRVGVVGAGRMGSNHVRIYSELKGVELVGILDSDRQRARDLAARHGCRAFETLDQIQREVDAATVAVPSVAHAEVAGQLLEGGVSCLVEKPLATTGADCRRLIEAARKHGCVLLVGHVERFNPVVQQLRELVAERSIHAVDVRRMSRLSSRITDVDVVCDLMIHDLDVILSLMTGEVSSVFAQSVTSQGRPGADHVAATLGFEGGAMACLTASRIAHTKVRELQVMTDEEFITVNYSTQELLIHRQTRGPVPLNGSSSTNYMLDLAIERVFIRAAEPLALEIRHFIDAVHHGTAPLVSGEDGLRALELVWAVQRALSDRELSACA